MCFWPFIFSNKFDLSHLTVLLIRQEFLAETNAGMLTFYIHLNQLICFLYFTYLDILLTWILFKYKSALVSSLVFLNLF